MTIEPLTPQTRRFEISNVLRAMSSAIGRNGVVFFGLAALLQGVPTAVVGYVQYVNMAPMLANGPAATDFSQISKLWIFGALGGLVSIVTSNVLLVALTHGMVNSLRGLSSSFADCLSSGVRYFLPAIGIGICVAVCVMFGVVFFIVPGVILGLGWCVAVPVLVTEGRGVFGSIGRSWRLTDGYKGSIFLLGLIYLALSLGLNMVGQAIAGVFMSFGFSIYYLILMAIISPLLLASGSVFGAAGAASAYYELRQVKEGVGVEALASVFE